MGYTKPKKGREKGSPKRTVLNKTKALKLGLLTSSKPERNLEWVGDSSQMWVSQVKARANSVSRKPCLVLAQKTKGIQAQQVLFLGVVVWRAKVCFLQRGKKGQFKAIFNPPFWKLGAWGQVLVKN